MKQNTSKRARLSYLLLSLFFIVIFFSTNSAAESFKQWTDVEISHPIRLDGALDPTLTANVTVKNPNGDIIVAFQPMTFTSANGEHNYTVLASNNGVLGIYPYCISATNGTLSDTTCFEYEVTPSGEKGLIGFYFIIIILSYGVLVVGIWRRDLTISILGTFALYFLGLHILFFGIDVFKNSLTQGFGIVTLGIAMYVSAKAAHEYIVD